MKFKEFYKFEFNPFEDYLFSRIHNQSNTQLEDSMIYSLKAGGKGLRPLILLGVLKALEYPITSGYPAATAIEMVHTYSLIHDDLPAMDNDDLRRGKPTNHIQFDEATAILAGDALLTQAFEEIAQADFDSDIVVSIIKLLAETAGSKGMVGGQQADINAENQKLTLESLESIHLRKTGELIRFSFLSAGMIAQLSSENLDLLEKVAVNIGLAYQIRDDLLDVIGDTESLGKMVGADEKLGKSTYPSLLGLDETVFHLKSKLNQAKQAIQILKQNIPTLDDQLLETFIDDLYPKELI